MARIRNLAGCGCSCGGPPPSPKSCADCAALLGALTLSGPTGTYTLPRQGPSSTIYSVTTNIGGQCVIISFSCNALAFSFYWQGSYYPAYPFVPPTPAECAGWVRRGCPPVQTGRLFFKSFSIPDPYGHPECPTVDFTIPVAFGIPDFPANCLGLDGDWTATP